VLLREFSPFLKKLLKLPHGKKEDSQDTFIMCAFEGVFPLFEEVAQIAPLKKRGVRGHIYYVGF
jgi:hypothetical protein